MDLNTKICRNQESNQGPSDLQSDALPTELSRLVEKVSAKKKQNQVLNVLSRQWCGWD